MIVVNKFLGQRVEILDDRRYNTAQGIWGRVADRAIEFGFAQPSLVLSGVITGMDWLADEGEMVSAGEAVAFAIAGKPKYIDTPIAGTICFNQTLRENPQQIADDPYGSGWIFRIKPAGDIDIAYKALEKAEDYFERLKGTEGFKNPEGIEGGVSGMCKAVYSSIRQQKI